MPVETILLFGATFSELPSEPLYHPINLPYVAPEADEAEEPAPICCACCDNEIDDGDAIDLDGEPHCGECVHSCENCGHQTTDETEFYSAATSDYYRYNSSRQSHSMLCTDCSFQCADCNERFANSVETRHNASNNRVCGACSEQYYSCDDCGCTVHGDDTHTTEENTYCRDCFTQHECSDGLHDYSYKPSPQFFKLSTQHARRGLMYLGVELEVDSEHERDRGDDIKAAGLFEHDLLYCKEDGSLDNGFEIVSHPASWEYWQTFKWDDIAASLKGNDYRSYDTQTCGMHIHVGRSALTALDIFKLLAFFRTNKTFIARLSRRRIPQLDRWSAIDESGKGDLAKKAKAGNNLGGARYTAINLENDATIEFRIFRGTLDAKAIKRNIALVTAFCRFVKATSLRQLWRDDFIAWLKTEGRASIGRPDSRELLSWILARCPENEAGDAV